MSFLVKLDKLMDEKRINKNQLSKEAGIPYTTIDGFYKKGTDNIKLSTLKKLATYFQCSLDYLADDNIPVNMSTTTHALSYEDTKLSEEEQRIIHNYRNMGEYEQWAVRVFMKMERERFRESKDKDECPEPIYRPRKIRVARRPRNRVSLVNGRYIVTPKRNPDLTDRIVAIQNRQNKKTSPAKMPKRLER